MTTKYTRQAWKCVGCVEVVDMCLTAIIVIFVNVVQRHIHVGHTMKSSYVAPMGIPTRMDVVLRAINVKVNVVDVRPLTLPQQGAVPVVWVENPVPRKTSVVQERPVATVVARKTSVMQERTEVRKTSGVQERLVAEVVASKTSSMQVRLVAKLVARRTTTVQESLVAKVVATKTRVVDKRLVAKVAVVNKSGVREKLVVCRVCLIMQAKRLWTPLSRLLGICGRRTRSLRVERIMWMMTRMRCCAAKTPVHPRVQATLGENVFSIYDEKHWEQGGHDDFTPLEEEDLVDADLVVAKLVKEIRNEKVSP